MFSPLILTSNICKKYIFAEHEFASEHRIGNKIFFIQNWFVLLVEKGWKLDSIQADEIECQENKKYDFQLF